MTERDYTSKAAKAFKQVPNCQFRILPDTGGKTHKKPYDIFLIYEGRHFSIEAKIGNGKLEEHQKKALQEDADAGGKSFVFRYVSAGVSILKYGAEEDIRKDITWKELQTPAGVQDVLFWMVLA